MRHDSRKATVQLQMRFLLSALLIASLHNIHQSFNLKRIKNCYNKNQNLHNSYLYVCIVAMLKILIPDYAITSWNVFLLILT